MTGERKALEARVEKNILALNNLIGRGTRIRTADLQYPKLPRYQAALYPGTAMSIHAKGASSKARGRQIGRAPSADTVFRVRIVQCEERAGEPVSGWISAAIIPLEPGPNRTSTYWPGRSSVMPNRRNVSMCTKISGVPSPQVRKPNPRKRLNHLTWARSSPLVGVTVTWVRGGNI